MQAEKTENWFKAFFYEVQKIIYQKEPKQDSSKCELVIRTNNFLRPTGYK